MSLLPTPVLILVPAAVLLFIVILSFFWRVVVDTNKVHIVQSRKSTTSYGIGASSDGKPGAGNVYYAIPSFIPYFGLSRIILPINNFALEYLSKIPTRCNLG